MFGANRQSGNAARAAARPPAAPLAVSGPLRPRFVRWPPDRSGTVASSAADAALTRLANGSGGSAAAASAAAEPGYALHHARPGEHGHAAGELVGHGLVVGQGESL